MNFLWNFMGYSRSYSIFTGLGELAGGLLLLSRRTTVLGCVISIGVMLNVVMLNFSYDVCVKLLSSHLLLFLFILLAPNMALIYRFFLRNDFFRTTSPELNLSKKWMRPGLLACKSVVILTLSGLALAYGLQNYEKNLRPQHDLAATYKTQTFVLNGDTLPPLATDPVRWDKMIIENKYVNLTTMARSRKFYKLEADTTQKTLSLTDFRDTTQEYVLTYAYQPENGFSLSGIIQSDTIDATFRQFRAEEYPLVSDRFHWIIE